MRLKNYWVCAGLLCALLAGCGDNAAAPTATTVASTKPPADMRPGALKINLSYFVTKGTPAKPDDGALVLLVPEGVSAPLGILSYMDQDKGTEPVTKIGGHFLKLGDSGAGKIDNILPGTYKCFLISFHSWGNEAQHEAAVAALRTLIQDWNAIANREVHIQTVDILPAKTAEVTGIFGE